MLHILKSDDNHLICKALSVLGALSNQWNVATYLHQTNITKVSFSLSVLPSKFGSYWRNRTPS